MTAQTIEQASPGRSKPARSHSLGQGRLLRILFAFSILYIAPLFMLVNASFKPLASSSRIRSARFRA